MKGPLGFGARVRLGLAFGVAVGALFSFLAVGACLVAGPGMFESHFGISCGRTVLIYLITLPISGIIGGVLGRLFRYLIGTFVVGSLLAFVPFFVFGMAMWGLGTLREVVPPAAGLSIVIGGGGFLVGRFRSLPRQRWWDDSPSVDAA